MSSFDGSPARGIAFLAALPTRDKDWFKKNRKTYEAFRATTTKQFVGCLRGILCADAAVWRAAIDDNKSGAKLTRLLDKLAQKHALDIAGAELKRVPPPFSTKHERADLLRHKMFQVRSSKRAPKALAKAAFAPWCAQQFRDLSDIHCWLVRYLAQYAILNKH